jgi:prevent-host-death family protein
MFACLPIRPEIVSSDQTIQISLFTAIWQVQDAKTRFSKVIELAQTEGPQTITKHGTERAVVLSIEAYRALKNPKPAERVQNGVFCHSSLRRIKMICSSGF